MNVRYRPLHPHDIPEVVEHLAAHPILGPRYGGLIEHLPAAINGALRDDYVTVTVFEEFQGSTARLLGAGMAVFAGDDFLHEAKTAPSFWLGPELVSRITNSKSPLLSEVEVREANSTVGLNLTVWHNSCHPEDLKRMEVGVTIMTAFAETFRGFRLKEVLAQADSLEQLHAARNAGGFYFDRVRGHYAGWPEVEASNFSNEPRNFGITRELASANTGSWVGSLFSYGSPQFGFSRGEQRLLQSALGLAGTDAELSEILGISLGAVKMAWRSIYGRVAEFMPERVPDNATSRAPTHTRGKQKRQRLLSYLRDHPEELRPLSRKLLRQAGPRTLPKSGPSLGAGGPHG